MDGRQPDAGRGVYGITTAAELVGMSVQTLRLYEARGLLEPDRTDGGTRRYSADDVDRLRRIGDLVGAGLNLAGIAMVLDLQDENDELHERHDPGPGRDGRERLQHRPGPDRRPRAPRPDRSAADREAGARRSADRRSPP